jgi:hypothetical protein
MAEKGRYQYNKVSLSRVERGVVKKIDFSMVVKGRGSKVSFSHE